MTALSLNYVQLCGVRFFFSLCFCRWSVWRCLWPTILRYVSWSSCTHSMWGITTWLSCSMSQRALLMVCMHTSTCITISLYNIYNSVQKFGVVVKIIFKKIHVFERSLLIKIEKYYTLKQQLSHLIYFKN